MLVLTHGLVLSPLATAFCARRPAASITLGLLVFVQLVIAAITTAPSLNSNVCPRCVQPTEAGAGAPSDSISATAVASPLGALAARCALYASAYIAFDLESGTRSCGRLGPARLGTTCPKSSSSVSVKTGSGVASVRKSPCALVYASTKATCSGERPESVRYLSVSASTGKKPMVAPYSGAMLAIVARSASASDDNPTP